MRIFPYAKHAHVAIADEGTDTAKSLLEQQLSSGPAFAACHCLRHATAVTLTTAVERALGACRHHASADQIAQASDMKIETHFDTALPTLSGLLSQLKFAGRSIAIDM